MNGPRRVQPAGAERPQAPVRPRVPALPRAQGRTPMRLRAGGTASHSPPTRSLPARRQAPVAGRVPLPATGAYVARSEGSRGLSYPIGIHLNFALGLSKEVGPPQAFMLVFQRRRYRFRLMYPCLIHELPCRGQGRRLRELSQRAGADASQTGAVRGAEQRPLGSARSVLSAGPSRFSALGDTLASSRPPGPGKGSLPGGGRAIRKARGGSRARARACASGPTHLRWSS